MTTITECPMCGSWNPELCGCKQLIEAYAEVKRLRSGMEAVGPWLSAALDDPGVCAEMKADIAKFFEAMQEREKS